MARFDYDPAGRPLSTTSLWSTTANASVSYGYDPLGRLQALTQGLAGTSADQALTFGYNAASQVVTREATNDSYASTSAANGTRGYSVNGLNQYTQAAGAALQYDLNGNLMSDGSTTYVYDSENRLVSASGSRNATLSYDPLGRLWQVAAPSGTTRFFYDGDRLMSETDGAGTTLRAYAHGPGADAPVVWWELTGVPAFRRFLHPDHQGSIVAVSDASNGNPLAINAYDPWGVPNAGNQGRFGYTGQAWIAELGLYYYKARFYSPTLGRFLQTDPVGYDGGINLYGYVGNDPATQRDPTGTSAVAGCGTRMEGQSTSGCLSYSSVSADDTSREAGPHQLSAYQPPEEENARRGFLGIEADPLAETRLEQFHRSHDQIRQMEPNNPQLNYAATKEYVPTWSQVQAAQQEAAEVQNRARVIDYAKAHGGDPQPGYRGGGNYANDGRGGTMILPGRGVTFREYDVRPYQLGVNRGRERIIIDSRGRVYYTGDHYFLFRRIR